MPASYQRRYRSSVSSDVNVSCVRSAFVKNSFPRRNRLAAFACFVLLAGVFQASAGPVSLLIQVSKPAMLLRQVGGDGVGGVAV